MKSTLRSGVLGATALAVVNQAVSSGSNFLFSATLVRSLPPEDFGGWALGFASVLLALNLCDALLLTPSSVSIAQSAGEERGFRVGALLVGALLFGVAAALVVGVGSWAYLGNADESVGSPFAWGVALASLCFVLKEAVARVGFAVLREEVPALGNLAFGAVLVAVAVWPALRPGTAIDALFVYASASLVGAAAALAALSRRTAWTVTNAWPTLRLWLQEGRVYVVAHTAYWLRLQAPTLAAPWLFGLSAVGVLNAGRLLISPPVMLNPALGQVALPRMSRMATTAGAREEFSRSVRAFALALGGTSFAYLVLLALFYPELAQLIVGSRVIVPESIGAAWGAFLVAQAIRNVYEVRAKALRRARDVLVANVIGAAVVIPACVTGARALGVAGVVVGAALSELVVSGVLRVLRRREDVSSASVQREPANDALEDRSGG